MLILIKIQKKLENLKGEFVVVVEADKSTKIRTIDLEKYNNEIRTRSFNFQKIKPIFKTIEIIKILKYFDWLGSMVDPAD